MVSRAKRNSPELTFTQLHPGHRACPLISHLNSPGEHTARLSIQAHRNYSNTQTFTVLSSTHLLLGRESARVGRGLALGAQHHSNSARPGLEPGISRLRVAHATTEPRRSTNVPQRNHIGGPTWPIQKSGQWKMRGNSRLGVRNAGPQDS